MSKLMGLTALKNGVSRNGFDLGRKNCFTAKVGELLPVMVEECIPGDKFKIKTEWFTRTMPVNSAAYTRIREYYDFFFVPTRLLWRYFPNFVTQMDNVNTMSVAPSVSSIGNVNRIAGKYQPYLTSDSFGHLLTSLEGDSESRHVKDILGYDASYQFIKLCNYLGYNPAFYRNHSALKIAQFKLNLFPFMAYQKIWYDYYRNSQWQQSNPAIFNCDYLTGSDGTTNSNLLKYTAALTSTMLAQDSMFTLRYCNWQKDMFTGVLPSPQFGDTAFASVSLGNMFISQPKVSTAATVGAGAVMTAAQTSSSTFVGINANGSRVMEIGGSVDATRSSAELSVLALRQAQALQKWKEISLSGNQDYKTQIEKHFGVKVSDTLSDMCKYIGGTVGTLDIGEVVNTNLQDNDYSAVIQGKGVGGNQGFVDFECHEHGYLMCIYHALPLLDYDTLGEQPCNLKVNPTDYAIPEFDKIGMQSLPGIYLLTPGDNTTNSTQGDVGYVPRYVEYKTHVDEIHGNFSSSLGGTLAYWVAPLTRDYIASVTLDGSPKDYRFFKCNPSVLDSIFVQAAGANGGGIKTDNLLINCHFDVKAVRNLDYDGLPY